MVRTALFPVCLVLVAGLQSARAQPQAGQPEIVVQAGHTAILLALAASPDGRFVASAGFDYTIKIWGLADGRLWRTLDTTLGIEALAFSPDSRVLASSADGEIALFDVMTGSPIRRIDACDDVIKVRGAGDVLVGRPSAGAALAFSPKGQFLASACDGDESVKVWDLVTGREARRFNSPSNPSERADDLLGMPVAKESAGVSALAFDAGERWLAAGTGAHTVRVWEFPTGRQVLTLRGHSSLVQTLAFSADGRFITGSDGQMSVLWAVDSGRAAQTKGSLWSAFDAQGRWLVVGSNGDVTTSAIGAGGTEQAAGRLSRNLPVALSSNGQWLIGSDDKTLVARNLATGMDTRLFGAVAAKRRLVASRDGSLLALQPFFGNDTTLSLKLWNLNTNAIKTLSGPGGFSATFSHDGRILAAAANDKKIRVWDSTTANELRVFDVGEYISSVFVNVTGSMVAASSRNTTRVWDVNRNVALPGDSGTGPPFSADSRWLVRAADNSIQITDAESGKTIRTITGARPLAFSPDARLLAVIADRTTVTIWDIANDREVRTLTDQFNVTSAIFSPDGRWCALRHEDQRVFLWDLEGRRDVRRFSGHTIGFTAGGALLWTSRADGITRFWTAESGALAASLAMIEGNSNDWAVATPDGRFDGTIVGIQKLLAWRSGDRMLPPDQFMDRRTPGLLTRLFAQ